MKHCLIRLLCVFALLQGSFAFAEVAATVIFASAPAQATDAAGRDREIVRGAELNSGDTLDTRTATVQLRFRDGASMTVQPATRLRVDEYRYSGAEADTPASDVSILSLLRGGFRTLTGWIGKKNRPQYRVGSTVATIGIRGTHYSAHMGDEGLRVHTIAGAVEVCNQGGCVGVLPGETVLSRTLERKPEYIDEREVPQAARAPIAAPPLPASSADSLGASTGAANRTAPPPPPSLPPASTYPGPNNPNYR